MMVRCPRCSKPTPYEGNPFRPFCRERCQAVDLGQWLSEAYRIADDSEEEEEHTSGEPAGT